MLFGYEAMLLEAVALLHRAAEAEDPDQWVGDGAALLARMDPIVQKITERRAALELPDADEATWREEGR